MTLEQMIAIDEQHFMNVFGRRLPVSFERGEGCTLYDTTGRAYLDLFAGIAVNSLGYAHPYVTRAVCEQAANVMHTSNLYYVGPQARLCELLTRATGFERVFFANSGAEANEGAMKLCVKYFYERGEDRYEILTANNSFHGRTLATVAATGQEKYQKPYRSLLPRGVRQVPFGDLEALEEAAGAHTAAVMLEVIQGEGGVIVGEDAYIQGVRRLCDERGLLLVIDEIQTGLCRTGTFFAYEHYGIRPDIVTCAKALGNGVPIGAVLAGERVASAFHPGDHGSTFGGNALACAAGAAVVETMLEEDMASRARETGAYLMRALRSIKSERICEVRGRGLMLGVALAPDVEAKDVVAALLERGFVTGTAAGNVLRLLPPLIITREQIDAFLLALAQTLG